MVLAPELIEHPANPGLCLACARESLRPDGRLVLATPNASGLRERFMVPSGRSNDPEMHGRPVCHCTSRTLRALAGRHGFEFEAIRHAQMPLKDRMLQAINRGFCAMAPGFSQTMALVFRRGRPGAR